MTSLHLTDRALLDLVEIDQYLGDLGQSLDRLEKDLSLFKGRHDYTGRLRFYRVREHVLVGDVIGGVGFVLTVWHGSMDFMDRLSRLEPELRHEAEFMVRQIEAEKA